jgi:hypothetical protein
MQWIIILEYWDMVAFIMVANLKRSDASAAYPERFRNYGLSIQKTG